MESGLYLKFLSQLRINIANKNLFFRTSLNVQELDMLQLLTRKGIVRRFFFLKNTVGSKQLYLIYPNHTLLCNSNTRLVIFSKNADQIRISLNALSIMSISCGSSHYILKTDKGLMTHQDAIKHRIGGILVCLLY